MSHCVAVFDLSRLLLLFFSFFFKQKTAYEMRISDWSSDVCSSDLADHRIDMTILKQLGANARFGSAPEQHTMRQDDGHDAILLEEVEAVQQKGEISG